MSDVYTYNVPNTIKSFAQKNGIALSSVDFKIINHTMLNYHGRIYTPVDEILNEDINSSNIHKLTGHIIVKYKISLSTNRNRYFSLSPKLATNKMQTIAIMTFKKDTEILGGNKSHEVILSEIRKIMAKNNLVPYLFDEELLSGVKNIAAKFLNGKLTKDIKLTLSKWPTFQKTVDAYTVLHCKKDSKNGIYLVKEHDKILEIFYPKKGEDGHDVFGRFIKATEPSHKVDSYTASADIKIEETENSKIFYAKKRGYIKIEKLHISIETVLKSSSLDVKSTGGKIESSEDYNIEINVESKDSTDDGVGSSMSLSSEVINIDGVVGSGAVLTGKSVRVSQSTHKTSIVKAEKVDIKVNRGTVYAKDVNIDILEIGTIYAENVTINAAFGGEVICKNVTIEQLKCDLDIKAEKKVEFGSIDVGKHSTIEAKSFIEKKDEEDNSSSLEEKQEELHKLSSDLNKYVKEFKKIDLSIKSNINSIKSVKAIVFEDKKRGRKPSEAHIKAIRNFNEKVAKREEIVKIIKEKQELAKKVKESIDNMTKEVRDLVISSKFGWTSPQKVKYKKDGEELTLTIDKNSPPIIELINYFA